MKILALEPYYGGSHRSFLDQYKHHSRHDVTILGLKAHHWKWRMRLGAVSLLEMAKDLDGPFDVIFASDFFHVPDFRALAPPHLKSLPVVTYFHENQITYPYQVEDERDYNYGLMNILSAAASDVVLFNSNFHRQDFLRAAEVLLKLNPNYDVSFLIKQIQEHAQVLHYACDLSSFDTITTASAQMLATKEKRIIVWNQRWEFDKNPESLYEVLLALKQNGVEFHLIVLGERFRNYPKVFDQIAKTFESELLQFGYCDGREDYVRWLRLADIVVSTANHEFFGVSVVEAMYCDCVPLLPKRLSYPELIPAEHHDSCLYESESDLIEKLTDLLQVADLTPLSMAKHASQFDWQHQLEHYDTVFEQLAAKD